MKLPFHRGLNIDQC